MHLDREFPRIDKLVRARIAAPQWAVARRVNPAQSAESGR